MIVYGIIIILTVTLVFSAYFNIKCIVTMLEFNEKHEVLADQIESSLDVLDDVYQRIARAAETPVMSDEPIVKELILDINRAKDAVLLVANKIVSFDQPGEEMDTK